MSDPQTPTHVPPVFDTESVIGLAEDLDAIDSVYNHIRLGLISGNTDVLLIFISGDLASLTLL
jgi:hypothetical protein